MMISTKGRYALRVMLDIASHSSGEYLSLRGISERQNISVKYLEAIAAMLTKAGFLETLRGKNGGYRLARPAEDYTAAAILQLTEGCLAPVSCMSSPEKQCSRGASCPTLPLWRGLELVINRYLEQVTLADLLRGEIKPEEILKT